MNERAAAAEVGGKVRYCGPLISPLRGREVSGPTVHWQRKKSRICYGRPP